MIWPSLQNGLAFSEKLLRERRDFVKRIAARAHPRARVISGKRTGHCGSLGEILNVEMPVAFESYRLARPAFTTNGLPTDKEVEEFSARRR